MNNTTGTPKLTALWEKIKQHKIITSAACVTIVTVIILAIIFAIPKTYKIGQEMKGKYFTAKIWSVEYTDNAAGQIKADEGYMFVIIDVSLTNKSRNEQSVAPKNFIYQNSYSSYVESYPHAASFNNLYPLYCSKCLLQSESIRGVIIYLVRKEIKEHTLYFKEYNGANKIITSFKINLPSSNLA